MGNEQSLPEQVHGYDDYVVVDSSTMSSGSIYSRYASVVRDSYKVCLAGKYGSGKTSIFNCVADRSGVNMYKYQIVDKGTYTNVVLHDTGGRERYHSITMTDYYRNCDCVVFVYDATSLETLHYVKDEFKLINDKELCNTDARFVLLRNKIDVDQTEISVPLSDETAYMYNNWDLFGESFCLTREVSALRKVGIDEFFRRDLFNVLTNL